MTVKWFSPLPDAQSGIAVYTGQVAQALVRLEDTEFVTFADAVDPDFAGRFPVRLLGNGKHPPARDMNEQDPVIYNIGNNTKFHEGILRTSFLFPGCKILHDANVHHLFHGAEKGHGSDWSAYMGMMRRYHGAEGEAAAEALRQGKCGFQEISETYPMTEYAARNATGLIVHSRFALDAVSAFAACPIIHCNLPIAPSQAAEKSAGARRGRAVNGRPLRLVVAGHLGMNRCIDQILLALSRFPRRDEIALDIVGRHDPALRLEDRIEELGLSSIVTAHGYLPEAELEAVLERADAAINLRNPTMGEASASQLLLWSFAIPCLVSRVGWYAEQDGSTVRFCTAGQEVEGITAFLDEALDEPRTLIDLGMAGHLHVTQHHGVDDYARDVLEFAGNVRRGPAYVPAQFLANRARDAAAAWGGKRDRRRFARGKRNRRHLWNCARPLDLSIARRG